MSLSSSQPTSQPVTVAHNTINFSTFCNPPPMLPMRCIFAAPPGSYGIWLGDNGWTGGSGYAGPAGTENVQVVHNNIQYVENDLVIGGGATT